MRTDTMVSHRAGSRQPTPLADAVQLPELPASDIHHIPGPPGLPWFGHTLQFAFSVRRSYANYRKRYGPDFRVSFFGYHILVVSSPELVKEIFLDPGKNFSNRMGWNYSIGELFAGGLMLRDFDDHMIHRRIMQTAFRPDAMRRYFDAMNALFVDELPKWRHRSSFEFFSTIKALTLRLATRVFVGLELGDEEQMVGQAMHDMVRASTALVRKPVPPLNYWKGVRARAQLEDFFAKQIPVRRRAGKGRGDDMFTQLCQAESDEGERFSEREIIDHMIFLLMAAHDTTASSLTTTLWALARYPDWQETLRDEVCEFDAPELAYEQRDQLPITEFVFKEALRLHPPAPFMVRRTVRDCALGPYQLPQNTALNPCSFLTHSDDAIWSAPNTFDPLRFHPDRAEHRAHSHAYYPFGGGAHKCIGMHFANMEVKAFLYQLLRRYRITAPRAHRTTMTTVPIPRPIGGLHVKMERL